jgi:hypothetical protein
MQKEALSNILGIMGCISAPPREGVQRVPVFGAEFAQSGAAPRHLTLRGDNNDAPSRSVESRRIACQRVVFSAHLSVIH